MLIRKELLYISADPRVTTVHVGFFPSRGRYFRKEMHSDGAGRFDMDVDLPKGRSFYHYFFNENFEAPANEEQQLISKYDPQKRAPIVLETEIFCPIQFANAPGYIDHVKDDLWEIRAITHQQWIKAVTMILPSGEYPLTPVCSNKNSTFWNARVEITGRSVSYRLQLSGTDKTWFLGRNGEMQALASESNRFEHMPDSHRTNAGGRPLHAGYQVLPDRWHRTKADIAHPGLEPWGNPPTLYNYFGGTIKGITAKLNYIAGLGFDFIYLNPVFLAKSYHRYDCSDYKKIDPVLGDEEDFRSMVDAAHRLGLKIILDISLNHCSTDFFAFRDTMTHQDRSPYRNWFEIDRFPLEEENKHNYSSWHGHKELPQFNFDEPEVETYFRGVATYWTTNFDIDGWRLDVATELPAGFIRKFVRSAKAIRPDLLIIGETWHNDTAEFTSEAGIDGIQNAAMYLETIVPFFVSENISLKRLALNVMNVLKKNTFNTNRLSWNFLSNHDLPRYYSIIKDKRKYLLSFLFLYALPGTPLVYYGEEVGMEGLDDPFNRGCMHFDGPADRPETADWIRELNALRKKYSDWFVFGSIRFPAIDQKEEIMVLRRTFNKRHLDFEFNFNTCSARIIFVDEAGEELVQIF